MTCTPDLPPVHHSPWTPNKMWWLCLVVPWNFAERSQGQRKQKEVPNEPEGHELKCEYRHWHCVQHQELFTQNNEYYVQLHFILFWLIFPPDCTNYSSLTSPLQTVCFYDRDKFHLYHSNSSLSFNRSKHLFRKTEKVSSNFVYSCFPVCYTTGL